MNDPRWISPAEHFFTDYHGRRLFFDWDRALEYAAVVGIIQRRKQQIHSVQLPHEPGRYLWHVRRIPPAVAAEPNIWTDNPTLHLVPDHTTTATCDHHRGPWICVNPPHPYNPDRHYFVHEHETEAS